MYTCNFSIIALALCMSMQSLAFPIAGLSLGGILNWPGFATIIQDIHHVKAPPSFGLLNASQSVPFEDAAISQTAAWLRSQLATVDLLYTHPTPVTASDGLKSVLSSGLKSATGGHATATTEVRSVAMLLCVPTSDIAPTNNTSTRATITSAPTVVPLDQKYITTTWLNNFRFPILRNFSSVAHVVTSTIRPATSTANTDTHLFIPLISGTPAPISTVVALSTTDSNSQEVARRSEPSAPSTTAPTSPSETSTNAELDTEGHKIAAAAAEEAKKEFKEPVVLHNCSYPQINGHRLGRDSKGDIVILVKDPWLEALTASKGVDLPGIEGGSTGVLNDDIGILKRQDGGLFVGISISAYLP